MKRLFKKAIGVLDNKRGDGYIDVAVKMIIAVVVGALLLGGLYYLFNNIVLPGLAERILLKRPPDKPIPHCNECKHCHKLQEGKRGIRHTCTHRKILSKHKETGGLHIDGRYARTSPPWCPRR